MIITLRPSATGTSARFVHTASEPPSLVIHDGTTTLVLCPADLPGGLAAAADFAQQLAHVATAWASGCRRSVATTQPDHRQPTASCTIKPAIDSSRVTTGPVSKPARRTGLVAARKAAGYTQEELAALLGVERSTVYRWESADTTPLPMLRPGLAKLLHLSDDQLAALLGEPVDQP